MSEIRTSKDIIREAARVFAKQEKLKREQRELDSRVRALCLEFGAVERAWGIAPWHLRRAVETRTKREFNV